MHRLSSVAMKLLVIAWSSLVLAQNQKHNNVVPTPTFATVPLQLEDNRAFVDLTFTRPRGKPRAARCWIDTGGSALFITESLAHELDLDLSGKPQETELGPFVAVNPPQARLGDMAVDLQNLPMGVALGRKVAMAGVQAECFITPLLLRKYDVVIDYPARQFTMARAGTLKLEGVPFTTPIDPRTGLIRMEATIAGHSYGFLLDSGATYTMLSQTVFDELAAKYADWPHVTGALGASNMIGGPVETSLTMVRVPEIALGSIHLANAGVITRPAGTFEKGMSSMMAAPVVGAIAGNLLRAFRVQIDYAHGVTYLEQNGKLDPDDLNVVGLIIQPKVDGSYLVAGVAKKDGKEVIDGVASGDKLLQVDGVPVNGKTLAQVLDLLNGKPGEIRNILLERNGKQFTISAPVIHFL